MGGGAEWAGQAAHGEGLSPGPHVAPSLEFGGAFSAVWDLWRPPKLLPSIPAWHLPMDPLEEKAGPLNSLMVLPVSWGPARGQGNGAALAHSPSWGWDRARPTHL